MGVARAMLNTDAGDADTAAPHRRLVIMNASTKATWGSIGRSVATRAGFAALLAGALLFGTAGNAAAYDGVEGGVAPPALRAEVIPRAPSPHYFWARGYWGYRPHGGYAWNGGRWMAPRVGYAWQPAHWYARGARWHFGGGYWRHAR